MTFQLVLIQATSCFLHLNRKTITLKPKKRKTFTLFLFSFSFYVFRKNANSNLLFFPIEWLSEVPFSFSDLCSHSSPSLNEITGQSHVSQTTRSVVKDIPANSTSFLQVKIFTRPNWIFLSHSHKSNLS